MYQLLFSLSSHLKYTVLINYLYLKNSNTHDTDGSIQIMTGTEICGPAFQVLAAGDQHGQTEQKSAQNTITAAGQIGWSFEQPGMVEYVPAHVREGGTRYSLRRLPTQIVLWFYQ